MRLLQDNPYRLLGVYANSPIKERLANKNKLRAFIKIGKNVTFPLDLPQYFPSVNRTEENIAEAETKLTLPVDQMRYAQFWFIKETPFDDVAFNHLLAGDMEKAFGVWENKNDVSSLQNRIVCALIKEDYSMVFECAEKLYCNKDFISKFVGLILGEVSTSPTDNYVYDFLDSLCDEIGTDKLIPCTTKISWEKHFRERASKPLIDTISKAIDEAKASKDKDAETRLYVGQNLCKIAQGALLKLNDLLQTSDMQYRMLADKLGLEILQCGIDYYNKSDTSDITHKSDVAHKAMTLQNIASKTVLGQIAKDRCQENAKILQNIIDGLPPVDIIKEYNVIVNLVEKIQEESNKITDIEGLLNKAKPFLQTIRNKHSVSDICYLEISTMVVKSALYRIIDIINSQNKKDVGYAWKVTQIMDTFDMEKSFKTSIYDKNREILNKLREAHIKASSCWQAALILHIICISIGIYIALNQYYNNYNTYFDEKILYWSIGIGAISWFFAQIDKGECNGLDVLTAFIARGGCIGIVFFLPVFAGYWIYKLIRSIITFIRL